MKVEVTILQVIRTPPPSLTLVMLYPDVSGEAVKPEGEAEDVVIVRRVSHDE